MSTPSCICRMQHCWRWRRSLTISRSVVDETCQLKDTLNQIKYIGNFILYILFIRMASYGIRGMSQDYGIKVCCCRICTCINFGFATSRAGLLKLLQLGLATLCEGLLMRYGVPAADTIGQALTSFLTTTAYCFTTTLILMICYCFSEKSFSLIRQSLFETLFNAVACFMYFSSASYMGFACVVWLHPQFLVRPGFWAYPSMTAAYYMGYAAGILHGIDAFLAFKHYKGFR